MNRLTTSKRQNVLGNLIGGKSIRSTARTCGVSINTVSKLLDDAGRAAVAYHDEHVRGIRGRRQIKCRQTWAFSIDDRDIADAWTFIGIDAESRLIVSQLVGVDVRHATIAFMHDLRSRLSDRPDLMTADLVDSERAVDLAFGSGGRKSKLDGKPPVQPRHPPIRSEIVRRRIEKHAAIAHLYGLHHNFCQTAKEFRTTPAMASGLDDTVRDMAWIVDLIDERTPKPKRPKTYRRRSGSPA